VISNEKDLQQLIIVFDKVLKWALENQWHEISRDKDGFAIDENLGEVIIREDDGTIYINDDDDYIHNTHCVYWMPIPSLSKELK
jgi:hypothetical protein